MKRKTHIVIGGVDNDDQRLVDRALGTDRTIRSWVAPKTTVPGDTVMVFIAGVGLYAVATAASEPRPRKDWKNRFAVDLTNFKAISPPISIACLKRVVPALTWANYPRSITTPPESVAKQLLALVSRRRKFRVPERSDPEFMAVANLGELRALALKGSRSKIEGVSEKAVSRVRSRAIHAYALARANGQCEGCGSAAPFKKPGGIPYLEPHHAKRVADSGPDHPSNVIALCPNCHRRVHSAEDAKKYNNLLIKKLKRLEAHRNGA